MIKCGLRLCSKSVRKMKRERPPVTNASAPNNLANVVVYIYLFSTKYKRLIKGFPSLHWWIQAFIGNKFFSGDLCVIMGNTTIGVSQLFSPLTCSQAFEAFFLSIVPRVFFF